MDKELIKEMRQAIKKNQIDDVKHLIQNNEGLIDTETIWGSFLHDAATFGTYEEPRSPPSVGTTWRSQKGLAFGLKALTAPPLC